MTGEMTTRLGVLLGLSSITKGSTAIGAKRQGPDRLYDAKRPRALEKAVGRCQGTRRGKGEDEPSAVLFQPVADQHGDHREQSKSGEPIHVNLSGRSQSLDEAAIGDRAVAGIVRSLPKLLP